MDNLQWFKFSPAHWFMGRIQRCSDVTQARFIRLCCLYWNKECILSEEDAEVEVGEKELEELLKLKIIDVENGMICIKFLHKQFEECLELGNKRSKAAKARWSKQKESKSMQLHKHELQDYADKSRLDKIRGEEIREDEEIDLSKHTSFDQFWKAYDYNTGQRQAQQEWSDIIREMPYEIPKILDNVPKYVKSKPDKKFRKKPENYLKERVWMDEIVKNEPKDDRPRTVEDLGLNLINRK